jgi:TonB family protein
MYIKEPCNENWDSMKIGLISRNCSHCNKNVMDFTAMSRKQILEYLILNYENSVCARIYPTQLDFSFEELEIVIKEISKKSKNTNLPFYFLAIGTLLIASCNSSETARNYKHQDKYYQFDSSNSRIVNVKLTDVEAPFTSPSTILGILSIDDAHSETPRFAQVMPEFIGGMDSLNSYMSQNIVYPSLEENNKIEAKIIVDFVVGKNGEIKNAKILQPIEKYKNFEKEALRVINSMPNWKPGTTLNEAHEISFSLPISFKLD